MPSGSKIVSRTTLSQSAAPKPLRDDVLRQHMGDVGVGEGRAEARDRLDIAQRADHRRLVGAEQADEIVGGGRQARALGEQVEHPELPRHPGVLHLEVRIEVDDAVVPGEHLAVDADRHRRGEEGLGRRADLEDGVGVDRLAALAPDAEALGIDQPVAADDADREPGIVEVLHAARDIGLEIRHERLDLAPPSPHRRPPGCRPAPQAQGPPAASHSPSCRHPTPPVVLRVTAA